MKNKLKKTILQSTLKVISYFVKKFIAPPTVLSTLESLTMISNKRLSISRFGDGEMHIINGGRIGFQSANAVLKKRLKDILKSDNSNHAVCIPNVFLRTDHLSKSAQDFWKDNLSITLSFWLYYTKRRKTYLDALITRFYMDANDKSQIPTLIHEMKKLWEMKKILIVEGENSKLGYGNDLFSNSISINRIICPSKNAFDIYSSILSAAIKHSPHYDLVLIALGPTATILAYDLAKAGIWALDIGHIDIEYEWYLTSADSKIPIPNKDVNEAKSFIKSSSIPDSDFSQQVVHYCI